MLARYYFTHRVVITFAAVLAGSSVLYADKIVNGNLTVEGNSILQGTLDVTQGVTIIGDTDLMGNIFSLGHSLNGDNSQNYSIAGLEIYIKNTNSTTRLIEQVTTVAGTTFKWGTRAATDLNANGILDDFGTQWMNLTSSTLTITGNLLINGTDNQLTAQTLTGANSILTRGLADARYQALSAGLTSIAAQTMTSFGTGFLPLADATSARTYIGAGTVTSVSVVTANGLSGTVDNPSTTPAITLNITALDASKIGAGTVSTAKFGYLGNVTSDIQTQINAKGDVIGPASSTDGNIALFSGETGKLLKSGAAMDGYINGVRVGMGAGSTWSNTVLGNGVMNANTTGFGNTALGSAALSSNNTGIYNTVTGYNALYSNTTGGYNTAVGTLSLQLSTTGSYNTAIGLPPEVGRIINVVRASVDD